MSYALIILPSARKAMLKLPKRDQERIDKHILALAENPHPPGAILLKGSAKGLWRVRVGDYRVLYQIQNEQLVVVVVDVGHRREVYRDL